MKPIQKKSKVEAPGKLYQIKKPQVTVVRVLVEIAGDRLLCDRLTAEAVSGYGETAVDVGNVRPLPKTPEEVFERAKYRDEDGNDAFPASGVRSCLREAAVEFDRKEVSKAGFNRATVVRGDMLPLKFSECRLYEKIGRNSGMTRAPRLTFRPLYLDWSLSFEIDLLVNSMNPSQLYSLIDIAGRCIGIGNWRPGSPKGGSHGTFEIKNFAMVEVGARIAKQA